MKNVRNVLMPIPLCEIVRFSNLHLVAPHTDIPWSTLYRIVQFNIVHSGRRVEIVKQLERILDLTTVIDLGEQDQPLIRAEPEKIAIVTHTHETKRVAVIVDDRIAL